MSALATDTSLGGALSLYKNILSDHPWAQRPVKGWGGVRLKEMCDPEGWVGLWMIKAEISARVLLGARLWDVSFQASNQAAEGVLPVDLADADMTDEIRRTYESVPGGPHILTAGLRFALAKQGLNQSLLEEGGCVKARPLVVPGLSQALEIGDYMPFPTETDCFHVHIFDFISQSALKLQAVNARRQRELNVSAAPGGAE